MNEHHPAPKTDSCCSHGPTRNSVLLVVLFFSLSAILLFRPIDDSDVFLQIKQGEVILDRLSLPLVDQFTYTLNEEATPAVCWLAQVMFASLYQGGSWPLLQIFHVILFSGSFILMARVAVCRHREEGGAISLFSLSLAVCLCLLVSLNNSSVRPQSIALFCFALILFVVHRNGSAGTKAMLIAPVAVVWQNAHPSLSIVIACFLVFFLNDCISNVRNGRIIFRRTFLYFVLLLTALQLIHPDGWKLFQANYANIVVSREWLHITEWLPPWHSDMVVIMLPFWFTLFFSVALVIYLRGRVRTVDLGLFTLMTLLTFLSSRFAIFWSIAMVPILASWIEQAKPANLFSWDGDDPVKKTTPVMISVLGIILIGLIGSVLHPAVVSPSILPEKGLKALHQALPQGKIYNTREWGSALIFFGYPDWKVHVDGRLYLFNKKAFWEDYYASASGIIPLDAIVNRYKPDAFFLHPVFHRHLVEQLKESGNWAKLYADSLCAVYLPANRKI